MPPQEELLAECANAAAHIAAWANRRGKRAADNSVPHEVTQSDPDSNGEAIGSGAADHGKAVLAMRLKVTTCHRAYCAYLVIFVLHLNIFYTDYSRHAGLCLPCCHVWLTICRQECKSISADP